MSQFCLRRAVGLLGPTAFVLAGCGGIAGYVASPSNEAFSIHAAATSVNTNGQTSLRATSSAGGPAAVKWTILRGENDPAIGQGTIDARGNYIPPASITRDSVSVVVQAQLRSDPTKVATEVLSITPGFLQPLTPENSALSAGGSVQISAQLAEVGSGFMEWNLSGAPLRGRRLGSSYGTLTQESCQHSPQNYTTCTVVYTAPPTLPSGRASVYAVGTIAGTETSAPVHILLNSAGVNSTPLTNQAAQMALVQMGSSGGNTSDADTSRDRSGNDYVNDCCGGTLGALLQDQTGNQFILSNNHVLAESDQASLGDTIVQPGLIDSNCDQNAGRAVGSLRYTVPLASAQTNVDAALASVAAGSVDPTGAILQLGAPGAGVNASLGAGRSGCRNRRSNHTGHVGSRFSAAARR